MLKSRTIDGTRPGPRLLVTGGVHGDEFEPMAAIRRLMVEVQPADLRGSVTLIPVVNDAAFLRGNRMAEDELDLARVCPGKPDGSVTEQTAHELSRFIRAADYYIDLHTGGTTLSVFPLAGYTLHADARVLEAQRRMAHAFNLPVIWGTPYLPGRSLSVAHDAGIPAIYAEYLGGARCDAAGIDAYVEGCLNMMAEFEMLARPRSQSRIRYVVEDDRENAGFMQVQNPAPMTGFFEPQVELGDVVRKGDPLGTMTDSLGSQMETVCSRQEGIVLVLRTFNRVLKGESLGVVLEVDDIHR